MQHSNDRAFLRPTGWRDICEPPLHHPFNISFNAEIQLDNELIADLNVQEYRKQIALVSQEPVRFQCETCFAT